MEALDLILVVLAALALLCLVIPHSRHPLVMMISWFPVVLGLGAGILLGFDDRHYMATMAMLAGALVQNFWYDWIGRRLPATHQRPPPV